MLRKTRARVVVAGVVGLLLTQLGSRPSAQQAVTGELNVVWGDPADGGAPQLVAYVASPQGDKTRLRFGSAFQPSFEALTALRGQIVSATGAAALALDSTEPVFDVVGLDRSPSAPAALETAAITGPQPWVTLRCRFGDLPSVDRAINTSILTGSSYPSIDFYWRETSYNNITLTGSVVTNWVTLPQPRSYYIGASANLSALATDCTAASDAQVNFTGFVGINMLFNDALDCCLWGGGMTLTLDGMTKVWRTTWVGLPEDNYNGLFAGLAHETGHGFGFPHSSGPYSATYDSRWDIMSYAWIRFDSSIGMYNPQGTIAYHKNLGGWIPAGRRFVPALNTQTTISLERLASPINSSNYLMAQIPIGGSATQFYTVELRDLVGHDAWLPGKAVILHRVTVGTSSPARVVDPDGNGNPNDAAAMWLAGETFTDSAAGISVRVDSIGATSANVTITLGTPVGDSLVLNFGSGNGLWRYDGGSSWAQIHALSPESVVVANLDNNGIDDLIIDFGSGHGVWVLRNRTTWSQLHTLSPARVAAGDLDGNGVDDVILHFAGAGLYVWYNSTTWALIHTTAPSLLTTANIDGTAGDDLIINFPGQGVWAFRNNSTWSLIHGFDATLIVGGDFDAATGNDDLMLMFPGIGLFQYANNATWSQVHTFPVSRAAVGDLDGNGRDDLVVDFGSGVGVWSLVNGATWSQIHSLPSESLAVGDFTPNGRDDVAIDFGQAAGGIWLRTDANVWQQVHSLSPTDVIFADLN